MTKVPEHEETFRVGEILVKALSTPCHTQDSICYLFEDDGKRAVFTGDTLFIGGWSSRRRPLQTAIPGISD